MLGGHRGRGAFVLRCSMTPPWSIRIADASTVSLIVQVRGSMTVIRPGEPLASLGPGDVAVINTAVPYLLASDPHVLPQVVVEPGQVCRPLGQDAPSYQQGVRTWGNDADGSCVYLTGTYELPGQVSGRLLETVPGLVILRADEHDVPGVSLLAAEAGRDAPGQDAVLDRLVDLVLITALRSWFARDPDTAPRWWLACEDRLVGDVLRLMHDRPSEPWTLSSLAAHVAVSRATLTRRFTELLGRPPMTYLTEWRLCLAADLLRDNTQTIGSVARQTGYASPFAFSTAFKRHYGQPPISFRQGLTS